jgi:hypothetical protein
MLSILQEIAAADSCSSEVSNDATAYQHEVQQRQLWQWPLHNNA